MTHSSKTRRSKAIYPALVLTLNCGLRDKELRQMQWGRVHRDESFAPKTRMLPLSGKKIPVVIRMVVVLPEPLGRMNP